MTIKVGSIPERAVKTTMIAQAVAWLLSRFALLFFAKIEIQGAENLEKLPRGVIFASNHASDVDPVLARSMLPLFTRHAPLFVVARQKRDYTWRGWKAHVYTDFLFQLLGAYPALKGTRSYEKSLKVLESIGRSGYPILIFTGGQQRTPTAPVVPHGGTGYLAWSTKAPVVPVAIEGTFGFGPRCFLQRRKIIMRYGAPLYRDDLFEAKRPLVADFKHAAGLVAEKIEEMRKDLRSELYHGARIVETTQITKDTPPQKVA